MCQCTLIVPCFNESKRFKAAEFSAFLQTNRWCRILFVNDGSTDNTSSLIDCFAASCPEQISALHLPRNAGKGEAVRQGILEALDHESTYMGYWDVDLATPLDAVMKMRTVLEARPEIHLVLGSRVQLMGRSIQRQVTRHYVGRALATCASFVLGMGVYDTQCGAKLWRVSPVMASIVSKPFVSRWIFDVELLLRWRRWHEQNGIAVEPTLYELPLDAWHDVPGSKLHYGDMLGAGVCLMRLFIEDRWNTRSRRVRGAAGTNYVSWHADG